MDVRQLVRIGAGPARIRSGQSGRSPDRRLRGPVRLSDLKVADDTDVIVTAVGTSAVTCNVQSWSATGVVETEIRVRCHTPDGRLTSSQFSLLCTTSR
jgi:hypothetical protein